MKKIAFTFLLLFCFSLAGMAQKPYSIENLQSLSQEDLGLYQLGAQKLQNTGRTLNIIGVSSLGTTVVAGILGSDWGFGVDSWSLIIIGGSGILLGGASLVVGIPMNLTGKKRVEKINSLTNKAFHEVKLEIMPVADYNQLVQKYQAGITLRLSF